MANEKFLGPAMNARQPKTMNPRPASPVSTSTPTGPKMYQSTPITPMTPRSTARTMPSTSASVPSRPVTTAPRSVPSRSMTTTQPINKAKTVVNEAISKSEAATSTDTFFNAMLDVVGGFSLLSTDVIKKNLDMALKTLPHDERTISLECVDYIMSNLGVMVMGLVLDVSFKESFKEAIMLEMQLDTESAESKAKKRELMKAKEPVVSSGSVIIGVTTFMPAIEDRLMEKMQHSFDMMDPYSAEFDEEVDKLTEDQRIEFGFIFSNFMYLIRAFALNDLFMSYVVTVIEKVKDTLHVS